MLYAQVKHPASGYVQGMNDLLAVFLVVLVDEVSEGDHVDVATLSDDVLDDVAADAYGLLNGVLESLDDHYVHRQPGLQRTIEEVDGLLRRVDASAEINQCVRPAWRYYFLLTRTFDFRTGRRGPAQTPR